MFRIALIALGLLVACSPNVGTEQELAMERCIGHGGVREQFRNSVICNDRASFAYPFRKEPRE